MVVEIILWVIGIEIIIMIMIVLIDVTVNKLKKTHPFRVWWEKHVIGYFDDY